MPKCILIDYTTLRQLYIDEQKSTREVAEMMKIKEGIVYSRLRNLGLLRSRSEAISLAHKKGKFCTPVTTENELRYLYQEKKLSIKDIAKLLGATPGKVHSDMMKYGIPRRGLKESVQLKLRIGRDNPNWHGGVRNCGDGYIRVYMPNHPRSVERYVLEHILVWEKTHGKPVPKGYEIHHLNGIKADNRPENLVALPPKKHDKLAIIHALQERIRQLERQVKVNHD
jgi:hypothetical protein